jgi:ATP-binding protein involved in chromosome partitioning
VFGFGASKGPDKQAVLDALKVVIDPDLHQDIVSLGFVQDVVCSRGVVSLEVRLTTPACPAKESLERQVRDAVAALDGVAEVRVKMTAATRGAPKLNEQLEASLGGVRNLIAVASGKGGVGKSATAVNVAYALAAAGAKVGLLDADIYGPSVQHMTGVGVPAAKVGGLVAPPERDGIRMLSMAMFVPADRPTLMRGPRIASVIQQFLTQFDWGELDYLIIDYPPGTGDVQITLAQLVPLTGAVMVTTPQEVALIDVRKAIAMFQTLEVPVLGVIETMSGFQCSHCGTLHPIFAEGGGQRVATEFGLPLFGKVPLDPAVVASADSGRPVVLVQPDAPSSRVYRQAAGAVAAAVSVLHASKGSVLESFELVWRKGAP